MCQAASKLSLVSRQYPLSFLPGHFHSWPGPSLLSLPVATKNITDLEFLQPGNTTSRSNSKHASHLWEVLTCLQKHGIVLNAEKCEWAKSELSYLGH